MIVISTSEKISTKTAAVILGASSGWVVAKMASGELPIGIYSKNGSKANIKIFAGQLADWLKITREELLLKVKQIEDSASNL